MGTASSDGSLVDNLCRATFKKAPRCAIVVTREPPGEYVWVENTEGPANTRRMLKGRLTTNDYVSVGRVDAPVVNGVRWLPPPKFDGPRFASWLRKWMSAEGLSNIEVCAARRDHPRDVAAGPFGRADDGHAGAGPADDRAGINTIAGIAHALGLELGYVGRQGLQSDGARWRTSLRRARSAGGGIGRCDRSSR